MSIPTPPIDAPIVNTTYVGYVSKAWEGFFTELYYTVRGGIKMKGNQFINAAGETDIRLQANDLQFNGLSLPTPTEDGQILFRNATGDLEWRNSDILDADAKTGDVEHTIATTAADTWIMMDDGTIGNAASGATTRANADTEDLFKLLYASCDNTICPVSGGRGASSQADYDAGKTLTLPQVKNRVIGATGASWGLGETTGSDSFIISQDDIPRHDHTVKVGIGAGPEIGYAGSTGAATHAYDKIGTLNVLLTDYATVLNDRDTANPIQPIDINQPSIHLNQMIKL